MRQIKRYCPVAFLLIGMVSCTAVKPYQMQFLNQKDMEPNALSIMKLETEAETYREGAAGGGGGKTGGGCGCN